MHRKSQFDLFLPLHSVANGKASFLVLGALFPRGSPSSSRVQEILVLRWLKHITMALVFMTNEEDESYHQGNYCACRQNQRYKGFFHLPPLPTLGFLQQFLYGTLMSYCLRTHPPGLRD